MNDGIFDALRKKSIDVSNNIYFHFDSSVQHYPEESELYCYSRDVKGGPAYTIVDGNPKTGWANNNMVPEDCYVSVIFDQYRVYIEKYSLDIMCNPPNKITVTGSNDGVTWKEIDRIDSVLNTGVTTRHCSNPGEYKIINITQIGGCAPNGYHRFHLHALEFYGTIFRSVHTPEAQFKILISTHLFTLSILAIK